MNANPSTEVVRDVELLKERLGIDAARSGVSAQPFSIQPDKVPDAAAGLVAVIKRLFKVNVRFVTAKGLPGKLNFDGVYIGRNTVYVNSDFTPPFSQVSVAA